MLLIGKDWTIYGAAVNQFTRIASQLIHTDISCIIIYKNKKPYLSLRIVNVLSIWVLSSQYQMFYRGNNTRCHIKSMVM